MSINRNKPFKDPFEAIPAILSSHEAIIYKGFIDPDGYGFSRIVRFEIHDVEYEITLFANECYLWCGGLQIPFYCCEVSSTWPNGFKRNLQFYYDGEVCAVIPLEEYPEGSEYKRPLMPCERGKETDND
jgi:hypothetical protein